MENLIEWVYVKYVINPPFTSFNNKLNFTATNTVYKAGTGITINGDNEISLSDPGQTAKVTIVDTDGNSSTLEFRNGLLVSGLTNGTTTGDITFGGTTLTFTNGFLTSQTTASGN